MATTTNYGWDTPDDTDLVKDGAAAIRTLGSSIDTTTKNLNPETTLGDLAYRSATANVKTRLALGSAGQVLRVNSGGNAPEWATTADQTPLTTKGDLFTFSTVDARLGVGANGTLLTADSSEATGLKWAAPAASTPTYRGAAVYLTSSISIPNNAWTVVGWTNEFFDSDAYHDNSTNNSRLTIPSGYAGKYLISGNINWDASGASSIRGIQIYKNGAGIVIPVVVQPITNGTNGTNTSFAYALNLSVADYIQIYLYQNTGGNLTMTGGTQDSSVAISFLGA